jgi:3-(3-hydroxy-phenyl)propionate hydroxylase
MTQAEFDTDVLIAGAGPVGKTIAAELARYGVQHRIVDKASGPKDISKAMILHARTQEVQELMGVLPLSQAQAKPMVQLQMHAYGKRIASVHAHVDSPHPSPLILGQDRTERILETHLNRLGGHVDWNTELVGFDQDGAGVTATLHSPEGQEQTVRARYLVGCEGSNSVVRKTLGLSFEGGRYEGEQFIQADCKIRWTMPAGVSYLYLTSDGYLMVIEMPDDIVRIFISLPDKPEAVQKALTQEAGDAQDKSNAPTVEEIRSNLIRLTGVEAELSDPVWLARYRTSHRYTDRFREGNVFVAGDAAHVHVPLGGQGMNTGIQDGFNLAWKLAYVLKGYARPELLDTYNAERHPVAKALIEGTDKGYTTILHPTELAQALVRQFGPFLLAQRAVQSKLMNVLEEINVAYRDTPLAEDHGGSHGPAAGELAPDAKAVRLLDLQTVRLFDLLQGTHWLLLLFGGAAATAETWSAISGIRQQVIQRYGGLVRAYTVVADSVPPPAAGPPETTLMDAELFLHDKYGVASPCLSLIRPDDYVGFRGKLSDQAQLLEYLDRLLNSMPTV